jgi:hypothetical protein
MRKLLGVGVVLMFAAGCGASSARPTPWPAGRCPGRSVGPDGQPITTLCDLLSRRNHRGDRLPAAKPDAPPSMTSANCVYGTNLRLSIVAVDSIDAANTSYWGAMKEIHHGHQAEPDRRRGRERYAMGNDFSGLGSAPPEARGDDRAGRALPDQAEIKLIQLAGRLLSRAHALGT